MNYARLILPFIVSCLVTPFCLILAIASTGAGHGNYLAAKLFFPYTMLSTEVSNEITVPLIILAVIQMPLYGIILGLANMKNKFAPAVVVVALLHILAVVACFLLVGSNFS